MPLSSPVTNSSILKSSTHTQVKTPEISDSGKESSSSQEAKESTLEVNEDLIKLIASSVNDVADESGWAFLGEVGNLISKKQPDFDARNYGFTKLTLLIKSLNRFDIEQRNTNHRNVKHIYIRNK